MHRNASTRIVDDEGVVELRMKKKSMDGWIDLEYSSSFRGFRRVDFVVLRMLCYMLD